MFSIKSTRVAWVVLISSLAAWLFESAGKRFNEAGASEEADVADILLRKRDRSEVFSKICLGLIALEVWFLLLIFALCPPHMSNYAMVKIFFTVIGLMIALVLLMNHFDCKVKQCQRQLNRL